MEEVLEYLSRQAPPAPPTRRRRPGRNGAGRTVYRLKISGGEIVDGTGCAGYFGTVLVEGDTVRLHRGDASAVPAGRTIDATGHVVCPGFVDALPRRDDPPPRAPPPAQDPPGGDHRAHRNRRQQRGAVQDPRRPLPLPRPRLWPERLAPLPAEWLSVAELLRHFDGHGSVNVAYILGNSPVRIWGVGWDDRPASEAEVADMRAVVREAMEEGAWGLSTGLDYPPGSYASTAELVALSQERRGWGASTTPTPGPACASGASWPLGGGPGDRAPQRDRGAPDPLPPERPGGRQPPGLPWPGGRGPGGGAGRHLRLLHLPVLRHQGHHRAPPVDDGWGPGALKALLRDPAGRSRIRAQMEEEGATGPAGDPASAWLTNFRLPRNKPFEGHSLAEIASAREQSPVEALLALLDEEGLGISMVGLGTNAHTLPAFVAHPFGMIGSDAILFGDAPNPRSYGCFPLVLAEFVRAERHLRLPEAIRKMTSFPAQRIGLPDRGILRDGFKADIVVFDKHQVKTRATRTNPKVYPEGIPYVIVNGEVVIDQGQHTGAFPGRALRRGWPT